MFRFAFVLSSCALALFAQQGPPPGSPPPGGGARQLFANPKNLKVLKPDELPKAMLMARTGLGEKCTFCHTMGDFANDSIDKKETARAMFQMVEAINANPFKVSAFGDEAKVTCYTCHRGADKPVSVPANAEGGRGPAPGGAPPAGPPPN